MQHFFVLSSEFNWIIKCDSVILKTIQGRTALKYGVI